jgi:ELWxxDGT repeat protein
MGGPRQLTSANDVLYFTDYSYFDSSPPNYGLWKSNGTRIGTFMLKKFVENPVYLTDVNGMLCFIGNDGTHGRELWKSDGTWSGTVMVKDINPNGNSRPFSLTAMDETVYFFATEDVSVFDTKHNLWKSDGTESGTGMVKQLNHTSSMYFDKILTSVDEMLYFIINHTGNQGIEGFELWKSDGTEAGTVLVRTIKNALEDYFFTSIGRTLYFVAGYEYGSTIGVELWKSDGTEVGTFMVKDINPKGDSNPGPLINLNGTLYFSADDGSHGRELWRSDGTEQGTYLFKEINADPNSGASDPGDLATVNGTLYFTADDGIHGRELWKSDGTVAGTVMVKDIIISGSADLSELKNISGTLYFIVSGDIWKSDGTEDGTVMVKAVTKDAASNPLGLTILNGILYFTADDGLRGRGLWKSDGTEAGTVMVKKNISTAISYSTGSERMVPAAGMLYFGADDGVHGWELWRSDGTEAGTVMVNDINPNSNSDPSYITNVDETIFFYADDGSSNGRELWKSDGTEAGTVLVKNINPFPSKGSLEQHWPYTGEGPPQLTSVKGKLFFVADDGIHGPDLWKSNGTGIGTFLCKNVWPYCNPFPAFSSLFFTGPSGLIDVNGTLYFTVSPIWNQIKGINDLWKSNGTRIGTVFVKNIKADLFYSANVDGTLFFTGYNSLWKSDGTGPGTVMIKTIDLTQDEMATGGGIYLLTNVNGMLYFVIGFSGYPGRELWRSDGTEAGTVLVKAMGADNLFNENGTLYFTGNDGIYGNELWKSDGTEVGTVLVADINPTSGSDPGNFTIANNTLYFTANDGTHGRELWKTTVIE